MNRWAINKCPSGTSEVVVSCSKLSRWRSPVETARVDQLPRDTAAKFRNIAAIFRNLTDTLRNIAVIFRKSADEFPNIAALLENFVVKLSNKAALLGNIADVLSNSVGILLKIVFDEDRFYGYTAGGSSVA